MRRPGPWPTALFAALLAPVAVAALPTAAKASEPVRCVQRSLNMLGYPAGSADGVIGPRTRNMARNIGIDSRLGLPGLTNANAQRWCDALGVLLRGAEIHAGDRLAARPEPDAPQCTDNPPQGFTRTISGMVGGDPAYLRVSTQFGGAVDSLVWRGKQYLNIFDHGRQISYAWQMDRHGECFNPTEPGSASDLFKPTSTSTLEQVCVPQEGTLTTRTRPAFWLAPGETGFCDNGTKSAVNTKARSDHVFTKTVSFGYRGIDNVIAFDATVTTPRDYSWMGLEMPTAYLTHEFTAFWRFDTETGELVKAESEPTRAPWSFVNSGTLPPVIATPDGEHALAAYGLGPVLTYEILRYQVDNIHDATSKWNIIHHEQPAPAGDWNYRSFAVIGTLEDVREAMVRLTAIHPQDRQPPVGYVDRADCTVIEGWAWDPDLPDDPIEIAFYELAEDGTKTLLRTRKADRPRADLAPAGIGNGRHAFAIPASRLIAEGEKKTIAIEAINPAEGFPDKPLIPGKVTLDCGG